MVEPLLERQQIEPAREVIYSVSIFESTKKHTKSQRIALRSACKDRDHGEEAPRPESGGWAERKDE
jgi:hypothetical protein